jgi:hypothetical protein
MKAKSNYQPLAKDIYKDVKESEEFIYQVLEHLSAGRNNVDLMKQKLIQAAKNLPVSHSLKIFKYF